MQPGSIVIYRERGHLALGVVQKVSTIGKGSLELLGESDKKLSLSRDRIFFDCRSTFPLDQSPLDRKRRLTELRDQIQHYAQTTDLKELWELLEADHTAVFTWQELAEFVVSADEPFAMAGVLDALWNQSLYFKEKQAGSFSPRDVQGVEECLLQQQREYEKDREQQVFLTWVEAQLQGQPAGEPPPGHKQFLSLIQGLALYGEGYDKRLQALQLLNVIGFQGKGQPWYVAFQLLVQLGIWQPDEELCLLRYHIPTQFSEEALQAAHDLPTFSLETADSSEQDQLEDLTALETLTIDDADTDEIDDALSLTEQDGQVLIGIHIADAGYYVRPHSILDKSALARGTTIYLPSGKFPMLPPVISEDKASLVARAERPALSFFVRIDDTGQLQPERITRSIVRVSHRLSYTEADAALAAGSTASYRSTLQRLAQLARKRKEQRIAQGAILIDGDEVKVKVRDGSITTTLLSNDSPSRGLVSECMIMANETAARYCHANNLPALYIGQPPPDETIPARSDLPTRQTHVHAARRLMAPSQLGTLPEAHTALGLPLYTQATSPLRRYTDLQMHHQIKHHLAHGSPLFQESQLQVVAASAQAAIGDARRCERESTRFWLLRLLEGQQGEVVSGQVVRAQHRRLFVELDETLLFVPMNNAPPLPLGTPVRVSLNHVDARRDTLSVKLVESEE